jgi:dTDP-4-amino-4,6-dideoxygalactose transaminase
MKISLLDLITQRKSIKESLRTRIEKVLNHGRFIMGPEILELERALSRITGSKYAYTSSSGTDSLLIALMALGTKRNDAVFLPSFTWTSCAEVIALIGAKPVFVDVDKESYNISIDDLEKKILMIRNSAQYKAKVIMAVDLYGLPANYYALNKLSKKYKIRLLADAAQSFGAKIKKVNVGNFAEITTTSFFPSKPLGCYGDGGALFTNNSLLAKKINSIRLHGTEKNKHDVKRLGINGRMDTLQAAILLAKLGIFKREIKLRNIIANQYDKFLSKDIITPKRFPKKSSAWAQYTIRVKKRKKLMEYLQKHNIPSAIYYPKPLHRQTAYKKFTTNLQTLKNSEQLSKEVLSLPMHPNLKEKHIRFIARTINKFHEEN